MNLNSITHSDQDIIKKYVRENKAMLCKVVEHGSNDLIKAMALTLLSYDEPDLKDEINGLMANHGIKTGRERCSQR